MNSPIIGIKVLVAILLYPFTILYGGIMFLRNLLYDKGLMKSSFTPVFSIGVGNLTVGGTGKTPHVEYLINGFLTRCSIATLSRGYGRKTKGFIPVSSQLSPQQVGDEPWQLYLKYGDRIKVTVGEKRATASEEIHRLYPEVDLLIMDDVFQHRAVIPDFSILLCDYHRPFFRDHPFPAGRLREFRGGAKRADFIVVSKCPADIDEKQKNYFNKRLKAYAPKVPVAFTTFVYGEVVPVFDAQFVPSRWLLVTGIANPKPLIAHLTTQQSLVKDIEFPDHHYFSTTDWQKIRGQHTAFKDPELGILITEKDYARLGEVDKELLKDLPLFYIPIAVQFLEGESVLLQNIEQAMRRRTSFPIN